MILNLTMNNFMKFFILIFILPSIKSDETKPKHYYKFIRCKSFDPKSVRVEFCNLNITKDVNIFNLGFTLLKNLTKPIYLQYSIARKTSGNFFQDYFRTELIEFCGVMTGAKTNPFLKGILDGVGKTAPELIHHCPYKAGLLNASNLIIDGSKTFNFPLEGTYKIELTFYGKSKTPLGLIRTDEVVQSDRDNSGRVELPTNI